MLCISLNYVASGFALALLSLCPSSFAAYGYITYTHDTTSLYKVDFDTGLATFVESHALTGTYGMEYDVATNILYVWDRYGLRSFLTDKRIIEAPEWTFRRSELRNGDLSLYRGQLYLTRWASVEDQNQFGPSELYRLNTKTKSITLIGQDNCGESNLAISPDGVAYSANFRNGGTLYRIDLNTGRATPVAILGLLRNYYGVHMDFGPDGLIYAIGHDQNGINAWFTIDPKIGIAHYKGSVTFNGYRIRVPGGLGMIMPLREPEAESWDRCGITAEWRPPHVRRRA